MVERAMDTAREFLVRKDNLRQCQWRESAAAAPLDDGQIRLHVDRFAFTSNNISYAVSGEELAYWNFFPAPEGWGRIPVWGFADVSESRHPAIPVGERVFGYLPMSSYLTVQPDRLTDINFLDSSAHRRPLPSAYQLYSRTRGDPTYHRKHEDAQALLWPLYITSFLIEDFIADNNLFGARQILLSSASSKTALGLAFLLSRNRPGQCKIIGLTSSANTGFVGKTGFYDEVVTYDRLAGLDPVVPTVYVDMAGDGGLLRHVHEHFGDSLKYSCIVGATHWEQREKQHGLPGEKPRFFFAPTQYQKRRKDWGPGGVETRFAAAWTALLPGISSWLKVRESSGPEAIERTYQEVLEGKMRPETGHILVMNRS